MNIPTLQDLLEAGVHFGHQTRRWHPKMEPFLFGKKKGIHIFDLEITQKNLTEAATVLKRIAATGEPIIFICTKRQARDLVKEGAEKIGAMHVTTRWLGGILTNFETLQRSLGSYSKLKTGLAEGTFDNFTKKERGLMLRNKLRLDRLYAGIAGLDHLPGAIVVVDSKREKTAVREANAVGVPVIALLDSNTDPTGIDYPIPGNDDAYRSVKVILDVLLEAVSEGMREKTQKPKVLSEVEGSKPKTQNSEPEIQEIETKTGDGKEKVKSPKKAVKKETVKNVTKTVKPKAVKVSKATVKKEKK
ncbi:30S ribosomal protein S2 [candidate division WWE3 bacterium RIFCSPLOWO2_01_FULL_42_11]|uniref:Small ribosomal subunit protein uS2 n=1 Tax=candidate division WWE3 bacterium RIFCSPLOWO2_01_FULL_42_11 TaxID=1802627 RepID=A0A1F4VRT5_UNCKA|nr:MAG: 30S ribosomal protein S2 [candidate division WWE3 bacterium RIFCSPLOWO2_01_FULL_42_11]